MLLLILADFLFWVKKTFFLEVNRGGEVDFKLHFIYLGGGGHESSI